jgi:hypothetical protein
MQGLSSSREAVYKLNEYEHFSWELEGNSEQGWGIAKQTAFSNLTT